MIRASTLNSNGSMRAFLTFAALFFATPALAQLEGPNDRELTARPVMPLEFGTFTNDRGGSVTVDPRSGACRSSGVVMTRAHCSFGTVEIRGEPDQLVLVELQPETSLQNTGTAGQMSITDLTMNRQNPVQLGPDGRASVQVGATLNVPAKANAGGYNGGFSVSVNPAN